MIFLHGFYRGRSPLFTSIWENYLSFVVCKHLKQIKVVERKIFPDCWIGGDWKISDEKSSRSSSKTRSLDGWEGFSVGVISKGMNVNPTWARTSYKWGNNIPEMAENSWVTGDYFTPTYRSFNLCLVVGPTFQQFQVILHNRTHDRYDLCSPPSRLPQNPSKKMKI